MNKIKEFFSKWAFVIVLCLFAVGLLFATGCSVYTAIENIPVGVIGICSNLLCLAAVVGLIMIELKEG